MANMQCNKCDGFIYFREKGGLRCWLDGMGGEGWEIGGGGVYSLSRPIQVFATQWGCD